MKEWWASLQARERKILMVGASLLIVVVLYFGLWDPLQQDIRALEKTVAQNAAISVWMQRSAKEVQALQGNTGNSPLATTGGRSLLSLVDQTAKRGGLTGALKRVEPEGSKAVRVWLEKASFDDMMRWLLKLEKNNGVTVATITIDRQDSPGRVNARIKLQGLGT